MVGNFTVFPNYLPEELRQQLLLIGLRNWDSNNLTYQPCGKRGYFNINDRYPEYLSDISLLLKGIMNHFNVPSEGYRSARHFIGVNLPTAFVTPHIDQPQFIDNPQNEMKDWIEIRYNTFLQRPVGGGVSIIDNTLVPLSYGEAIAFRADVIHSTTPVEGQIIRVMFSIGSVVHPKYATFLNKN
jgi:hypothetical protein